MLEWKTFFGILAGIFSLLGFVPYIITICQGKTQPNRASWSIWAALGIVLAVSNYDANAKETMWLLSSYAFCQLIIAVLSIKYGEGGWNIFDRTCLLGAGLSIILWQLFDSPSLAIFICIAIDSLGALPTIKKSYYQPETEDLLSWMMFWIAGTFNLCALDRLSIVSAQPIYLFSFNSIVIILLFFPKINSYKRAKLKKYPPS